MTDRSAAQATHIFLNGVARSGERSSLFWWLYDRHDAILAAAAGARIRWEPHLPLFQQLGLSDGRGNAVVNARVVSDTWAAVKREIARRRQASPPTLPKPHARSPPPSRTSVDWRPPMAAPAPAPAVPRAQPTPPINQPAAEADLPEAVKAKLAALDRQLEWRDRFLHPPKRKE